MRLTYCILTALGFLPAFPNVLEKFVYRIKNNCET